jgi:hypothetical protein
MSDSAGPASAVPAPTVTLAQALNEGYACQSLERAWLHSELECHPTLSGLGDALERTHPHLFSATQVFVSETVVRSIAATVAAIERVAMLPLYQQQALARVDPIAQTVQAGAGMFMGYDFHIGPDGPKLIEVNTNAGGAFLNAALARAQRHCCDGLGDLQPATSKPTDVNRRLTDMFWTEWQLQRGQQPLQTIAIVDDQPQDQYLAPEFEICRQLLAQRGVTALVADAGELTWRDGHLWHRATRVDMVYNRLTDFYLTQPGHGALRQAYMSGAVVVSPAPRTHALLANKANLVTLSRPELLRQLGATPTDQALLSAVVPRAQRVRPAHADVLWATRRGYFFKPLAGYGSKASYRGDKLTRRVWSDILAGEYIAQALVAPGERRVVVNGLAQNLKYDLRAYSYAGQVQLLAARLYAGQTTNLRTLGGGFAPVVVVPEPALSEAKLTVREPQQSGAR